MGSGYRVHSRLHAIRALAASTAAALVFTLLPLAESTRKSEREQFRFGEVLRALTGGFDGVLIGGCRPGDCHYQSGNYKARRRITVLQEILKNMGFDEDRVWLRWISASEGSQFAATVADMVEHLRSKGPSALTRNWNK